MMKLTEFGKVIRKSRVEAEVTLLDMADALNVSSSFLSSLETGRRKVPKDWVSKIQDYFTSKGIALNDLGKVADVSNETVDLSGLAPAHQMLVAGFARATLDADAMEKLKALLEATNVKKEK